MTSIDADPRTPRQAAEHLLRRGHTLGDPEMVARGRQALRYAEEQEARRPSQVYQVEHDRFEETGKFGQGVKSAGQVFGLTVGLSYLSVLWFGLFATCVGLLSLALGSAALYAGYCAIRRARL